MVSAPTVIAVIPHPEGLDMLAVWNQALPFIGGIDFDHLTKWPGVCLDERALHHEFMNASFAELDAALEDMKVEFNMRLDDYFSAGVGNDDFPPHLNAFLKAVVDPVNLSHIVKTGLNTAPNYREMLDAPDPHPATVSALQKVYQRAIEYHALIRALFMRCTPLACSQ